MRIAKVIGHVVATVRSQNMSMDKLCLVEFIGKDGVPTGDIHVAMDQLGTGIDEWVMVVSGSSARIAYVFSSVTTSVDLCIVAIIDEIRTANEQWYNKRDH